MPRPSTRAALANLGRRELDRLFKALRQIEYDYDLIIVDHGAGMGLSTQAHLAAADALLLVTQPEPTALSDAYAVYKRSRLLHPRLPVGVVVNRAPPHAPRPAGLGGGRRHEHLQSKA